MVPWWQEAHWRSFRHFAASVSRNARPRSTAFLGSSARVGPAPTTRRPSAASATQGVRRTGMVGVLEWFGSAAMVKHARINAGPVVYRHGFPLPAVSAGGPWLIL